MSSTPIEPIKGDGNLSASDEPVVLADGIDPFDPEMLNKQQPKPVMRLGEKLISLGLISADQLQVVLVEQKSSKKLLGAIMVEMGFITESALGEVLAESSGTKKFDSKISMLDSAVVRRIPKEVAARHKVIGVSFEDDVLVLAMADVYNVLAIDQVRRHLPRSSKIVPVYCTETEIFELIDQYYDYEISLDGILRVIGQPFFRQDRVIFSVITHPSAPRERP
jgi:general secretion pathway protein E/type IV pilus assembly protein PilB